MSDTAKILTADIVGYRRNFTNLHNRAAAVELEDLREEATGYLRTSDRSKYEIAFDAPGFRATFVRHTKSLILRSGRIRLLAARQ